MEKAVILLVLLNNISGMSFGMDQEHPCSLVVECHGELTGAIATVSEGSSNYGNSHRSFPRFTHRQRTMKDIRLFACTDFAYANTQNSFHGIQ